MEMGLAFVLKYDEASSNFLKFHFLFPIISFLSNNIKPLDYMK